MRLMPRKVAIVLAAVLSLAVAAPAAAILNGQPDNGEHPYVGQLFFFVPHEINPSFPADDPGSWFNCSGTLISATILLTAGHCTWGTGLDGEPTNTAALGGRGGNDVWVTFLEDTTPAYAGLPPTSDYVDIPGGNQLRYADREKWLDGNRSWVRGTAYSHPQYDDNAFYLHDAGVVILDKPVRMPSYGRLPSAGFLDQFADSKLRQEARFQPVGYGVEASFGWGQTGGDTRKKAESKLINIEVTLGIDGDVAAAFSNNNGKVHRGGTCSGDSGGPIFYGSDEGDALDVNPTIVAVNSFGISGSCKGVDGGYRVDQADDLTWLAAVVSGNP